MKTPKSRAELRDLIARVCRQIKDRPNAAWSEDWAAFIAAACPSVLLGLLTEREADKARIAELEAENETFVALRGELETLSSWQIRAERAEAELAECALRQAGFNHLKAELAETRKALIAIGRGVGCLLADDVSTEFLCHVPGEVSAHVAAVEAELTEARAALQLAANLHLEVCAVDLPTLSDPVAMMGGPVGATE